MKLVENWKRFWTLNRHHAAGFTLVELIVVIAILAILAGVAVPAYSGYIAQANKAADEQLLATINQAFAAACLKNGTDIGLTSTATIILEDGKVDLDSVTPYKDAFTSYYEGNKNAAFKVIRAILFDSAKHMFVDAANGEGVTVVLPGGGTLNLTSEQVETILKSTYASMGGSALAGQVDSVANLAAAMIQEGFNKLYDENYEGDPLTDPGMPTFFKLVFSPEYAQSLGYTDLNDLAEKNKLTTPEEISAYLANSLVISAANGSTMYDDVDTVIANLKTDDTTGYINSIKDKMANPETAQEGLAEAAVIYGVYTSYVKATDPENADALIGDIQNSATLIAALDKMQGEDFSTYMNGQGEDDVKAYLEAMNVINGATGGANKGTAESVMSNGFTDEEIVNLLSGLLGKK